MLYSCTMLPKYHKSRIATLVVLFAYAFMALGANDPLWHNHPTDSQGFEQHCIDSIPEYHAHEAHLHWSCPLAPWQALAQLLEMRWHTPSLPSSPIGNLATYQSPTRAPGTHLAAIAPRGPPALG